MATDQDQSNNPTGASNANKSESVDPKKPNRAAGTGQYGKPPGDTGKVTSETPPPSNPEVKVESTGSKPEPDNPVDGGQKVADDYADRAKERAKKKSQPMMLMELMDQKRDRIIKSLPTQVSIDRWISVILALNNGDPKLQACHPGSILACALQGATLGLSFDKVLGEAHLIPRGVRDDNGSLIGMQCTFMPGYKGLRKLVLNNREIVNCWSKLVYEGELSGLSGKFVYQFTPDLEFLHQPCNDPQLRGDLTHAYAVAKFRSGEFLIEVMTIEEIEESGHKRSEMYKNAARFAEKNNRPIEESGPWAYDYEMMCRKTVLKRLCGQLPMTSELMEAITLDNKGYVSSFDLPGKATSGRGRGADALVRQLEARVTTGSSTDEGDTPNIGVSPEDMFT